jgi:hypothetical protein
MWAGVPVMVRNTLTLSPKKNQQSASPDGSTVMQMDILVGIALGHPPSVENAIGPEKTTEDLL